MATIMLEVPDELLTVLPGGCEEAAREILLAAAMHWCNRGELSVGWGARLAGLTYADFMDEAARRKFELFPVDIEEFKQQLACPLPGGVDVDKIKEELARAQSSRR